MRQRHHVRDSLISHRHDMIITYDVSVCDRDMIITHRHETETCVSCVSWDDVSDVYDWLLLHDSYGGVAMIHRLTRITWMCGWKVTDSYYMTHMGGWLWFIGSLKIQVSFAEYSLFYRALLQKRPMFLGRLLIVATSDHMTHDSFIETWLMPRL